MISSSGRCIGEITATMSLHQSVNTFEDSEEVPVGNHAWAACNSLQTCVLGMLPFRKYLFYFILP